MPHCKANTGWPNAHINAHQRSTTYVTSKVGDPALCICWGGATAESPGGANAHPPSLLSRAHPLPPPPGVATSAAVPTALPGGRLSLPGPSLWS
ncbi:uncharacterized protein EI97DRAFT_431360 [Westerdykella ornata]|uniref:Uncharacterized protein n=1 Tax=Westerdykella ornata TaxID=318751 RepID=A0A6A6JSZ0_WESOR|nr:uncharacterized protein EI97DRAFT_431360 [Westerdykella ornata]KAF2278099.1 hypothetical protein EI97DRAFT_431360 [Westerdykella ornata]